MTIRATFETAAFERQLRRLSRGQQFAAANRGLKRGGQTMRKVATSKVQSVLNLKTKPIRDLVTLRRVNRRSLVADLVIDPKSQPIIGFKGVRQTNKGVSVQIRKGGARRVIRSAFKATMPSGHTGVFRRRKDSATGRLVGRLKIDELRSTSVRQVMEDRKIQRRVLDAGRDRFTKEFRREVRRRLATR